MSFVLLYPSGAFLRFWGTEDHKETGEEDQRCERRCLLAAIRKDAAEAAEGCEDFAPGFFELVLENHETYHVSSLNDVKCLCAIRRACYVRSYAVPSRHFLFPRQCPGEELAECGFGQGLWLGCMMQLQRKSSQIFLKVCVSSAGVCSRFPKSATLWEIFSCVWSHTWCYAVRSSHFREFEIVFSCNEENHHLKGGSWHITCKDICPFNRCK